MAFITKRKLSDLVLRRLRKYKQDTDVTEQEILEHIHQDLGRVILSRYYQTKADEYGVIDGALVYTFKRIDVQKDLDTDEYFISLPSSSLALPFGMDIKMIAPIKDPYNAYRQVENGFTNLFNGLAAQNLEDSIGYYKENTQARFVNVTDINAPEKVLVKVIAPIDGVSLDEPLNIPKDMEAEVLDSVVQRYLPTIQIPADETNDGIDMA